MNMNAGIPTILHIEDDGNDRLLTKIAFKKAGLAVNLQCAENGEKAIAYLSGSGIYNDRENHPFPKLVLLDLRLPRSNGLDFLNWRRQQEQLRELPVVVLSSSSELKDKEETCRLGANGYFPKPLAIDLLQELLAEIYSEWLG
jgi:CheY-like chemotaxis protein